MKNPPVQQHITDTLETNYMPYAMSVIISRAIPEIDGFKPSHRKLLYTMYKMGLLSGGKTKSANVVGQTMKLNPHGDMAIYETMVRMTTGNAALLHPYVESKGNFGKQYSRDMAFAAPRYTEVKLDPLCAEVFGDIDRDTVDFTDNYDGTMKEPLLLPVSFPSILLNSNQGIAVGMASNICSFNLRELCEATEVFIKNPSADLTEILKAPDFSTGGYIIYNRSELEEIYKTGRGGFRLRSKYRFDKKLNCIEVFEIPHTTTSEAIIDKIIEHIKGGKIKEITDVRDETDLSGLKITFDLKRGTDPKMLMTKLFKLTTLEDVFSCNFNILINGSPRVMGVHEILDEWTRFRTGCVKRRIGFDIKKMKERLHLLLGLKKILLDIDRAISIIRNTEEESMVIQNLMEGFDIEQDQAEYVAEIKLRHINREYILKRTSETDELAKEIERLEFVLGNEKEIRKIIIADLRSVSKKYGKERKTEILHEDDVIEYKEEEFIEDYNLKVFFTKENYLKKISLVSLRSASEQKLKEGDSIVSEFDSVNTAELLMFSDKQNVYKMRLHEIADCKASVLGEYLPNVLGLPEDEKIVYAVPTTDYTGHILFAFENGKISQIEMSAYQTKQNRKKLTGAYGGASPLVSAVFVGEDTLMTAFATSGKVLAFGSSSVPVKVTRSSQGVQVLRLNKGSSLSRLCEAEISGLKNPEAYKTRKIPAGGFYLKDEDDPQTTIFSI